MVIPAVQKAVDPADLALARRPVAEDRVNVAIDQAGRHRRPLRINEPIRCVDVAVLLFPDRSDDAVDSNDGVRR